MTAETSTRDHRPEVPAGAGPDAAQRVPGFPVLRATLRRERRGSLAWGVGTAAMSTLYWGLWPTIRNEPALLQLKTQSLGKVGEAMGFSDLTNGAKYLDATVFGLMGPLLLIIFAVIAAGRAVAGDDEQGLLDLYLAQPVSRRRYLLERVAALAVQVGLLATVAGVVVITLNALQSDGLAPIHLAVGAVGLALLGLTFGLVALTVGAAVGRRGVATGTAAATALACYLAYGFAGQVEGLSWLRYGSPFWWFTGHSPAAGGLTGAALLVLTLVPVGLVAAAVPLFDRRDVGV